MKKVENTKEVIDVMELLLSAYLDNTRDYKNLFNAVAGGFVMVVLLFGLFGGFR